MGRLRKCLVESSRPEGMWLGWRTPRVGSLKLVNYTIIENACKERKKTYVFYHVTVIFTITKVKEQIGVCVSRADQCGCIGNNY